MYLVALSVPSPKDLIPDPVRAIYNANTGETNNPRWYWDWGMEEWTFNATDGNLVHFVPLF